jgi:hypothetical protein
VNASPGPRLSQPRDLTALFRDALAVYFGNIGVFIALAAVVVVPVQLIVSGVGLEQLTAAYDPTPAPEELAAGGLLNVLVVTPLITAICIHALHALAAGEQARPGSLLVEGFEAFSRIFFAVALAALGVAIGFVAFIVPGVYLFIRWYFVPQAVVVEGAQGPAALSRSTAVTRGFWWRTLGIVVIVVLAALVPQLVIAAPFTAIADSTDRAVWSLIGAIVTETITAPFVALFSTLLYYDLRARGSTGPAG